MAGENDVSDVYRRLIEGWNAGHAERMSAAVAEDGIVIGFDGSQMHGRSEVSAEIGRIFADHETATYVTKVRRVRMLGPGVGLLEAVAGMIPPGKSAIMPERNAIQTVVARQDDDGWSAVLFQTTPAQFHGRPALAEALTRELTDTLSEAQPH